MSTSHKNVTEKTLLDDFRKAGIKKGDKIFVHSSFKSLGLSGATPETVVNILKTLIGKEGTIGMPLFSYSFDAAKPFDVNTSPSKVGSITEAFRNSEGVVRSLSPSHSVGFWGKDAEYCASGAFNLPPYSMSGPFGKLYEMNFKIIMLGCGVAPNSTIHAIEHWAELPYCKNGIQTCYSITDESGRGRLYAYMPVGHRDFYLGFGSKYVKLLKRYKALHYAKVGNADTYWMYASQLVDICMKRLDKEPDLFLCDKPECSSCKSNKNHFHEWKRRGGTWWNKIWVGAAKSDITPGAGCFCNQGWGPGVSCEGIKEKIYVRVIVFKRKRERFALISVETCVIDRDISLFIKRAICGKTGIPIENIIITTTHTHYGPCLGGKWIWKDSNIRDDAYIGFLAEKASGTVYEALSACEPVTMGFAVRKVDIDNINRRIEMPDGTYRAYSINEPLYPAPNGKAAYDFSMIFFKNRDGILKAGIGHYACHPIFGNKFAKKIFGDFPGIFSSVAERELGSQSIILFLQGACGDQIPRFSGCSDEKAVTAGKKLAYTFLFHNFETNSLPLKTFSLTTKDYKIQHSSYNIITSLHVLKLNSLILGFTPGEPFYSLAGRFRENVGKNRKSILCACTDALGYLPDKEAFKTSTYEVESCKRWIKGKQGIGEEIIDKLSSLV